MVTKDDSMSQPGICGTTGSNAVKDVLNYSELPTPDLLAFARLFFFIGHVEI
jgi:hypothetical protein